MKEYIYLIQICFIFFIHFKTDMFKGATIGSDVFLGSLAAEAETG